MSLESTRNCSDPKNILGVESPSFKKCPVLINHYTLTPRTSNISRSIAGEYVQKSFKRLFWDRPSFTACYGNNEVHIHPEENRRLTVREAARIQTFPDFWTFLGGLTTEFKQIGNAVPVYLAHYVISAVLKNISSINHRALSLFSGIGGLDIGAECAGLEIEASLEIDPFCVRGLKLNQEIGRRTNIHRFLANTAIIQADLSKQISTTKDFVEKQSGKKLRPIGLIIGGPPCQAFSSAGSRKGLNDERGLLYLGYLNALKSFKPHTFIFENVIGLKSLNGGATLETIKKDFLKLGYNLTVVSLDAVNFDVPQHRKRIFLIGTFDSERTLDLIQKELNSVRRPIRNCRSILENLPPAKASPKNHNYDYCYFDNKRSNWDLGDAVFAHSQPNLL